MIFLYQNDIKTMSTTNLEKLFIFGGVFCQYTDGIAFAVSKTKEEAIDKIVKVAIDDLIKSDKSFFRLNPWDIEDYIQLYSKEYRKIDIVSFNDEKYGIWMEFNDDGDLYATKKEKEHFLTYIIKKELNKCKNIKIMNLKDAAGFCAGGD